MPRPMLLSRNRQKTGPSNGPVFFRFRDKFIYLVKKINSSYRFVKNLGTLTRAKPSSNGFPFVIFQFRWETRKLKIQLTGVVGWSTVSPLKHRNSLLLNLGSRDKWQSFIPEQRVSIQMRLSKTNPLVGTGCIIT